MDTFGLTFPVGGDFDLEVWDAYHQMDGRPQYAVIDRNFDVVYIGTHRLNAEARVIEALED